MSLTDEMIDAGLAAWEATAGTRRDMVRNAIAAALSASPTDDEVERVADELVARRIVIAWGREDLLAAVRAALQAIRGTDEGLRSAELYEALKAVEPHLDAIICYASTMGEHEPNRIAFKVREALSNHQGNAR